jgi:predicted GTPase
MAFLLTNDDLYINICIFGPTSVGKSTLLNALFVKQYSDMKIKRTTAVPQIYHEYPIKKHDVVELLLKDVIIKNREVNDHFIKKTQSGEIMKYEEIKELKYFVPSVMDLIKLHQHVLLRIYDMPGLDDKDNKKIYHEYLTNNFHNMDVAIVIFDINSSLNTAGEVEILELAINNIKNNNVKFNINVELIILINKCDDMLLTKDKIEFENEEHQELYDQAKDTINNSIKKLYPELKYHILTISCEDAFIYRMFKADSKVQLDAKQMNKFGINEYGKAKWNKLEQEEKKIKIKELLSQFDHKERMTMCGFEAFKQKLINIFTAEKQYEFIVHHIKYELYDTKESESVDITDKLEKFNLLKNKLTQITKLFEYSKNEKIKKLYGTYSSQFNDFIEKYIIKYNEKHIQPIISNNIDEKTFDIGIAIQKVLKQAITYFGIISETIKKNAITNNEGLNKYYIKKLNDTNNTLTDIFGTIDKLIENKYEKINDVKLKVFSKILHYIKMKQMESTLILQIIQEIVGKYYDENKPNKEIILICFSILDDHYLNIFYKLYGYETRVGEELKYLRNKASLYTDIICEIVLDEKCMKAINNICYLNKSLHMWQVDIDEKHGGNEIIYLKNRLSTLMNRINSNIGILTASNIRKLIFDKMNNVDLSLEEYVIKLIS